MNKTSAFARLLARCYAPDDGGGAGGGDIFGGTTPPVVTPPVVATPPAEKKEDTPPKEGEPGFPKVVPPKEGDPPAEKKEDAPAPPEYFGKLEEGKDYEAPAMAEGFELDTKMFDSFKPIAKELGLNQKGVQKLAEFQAQARKAEQEAYATTVNEWGETTKKDAEIGGAKFEASAAAANKALNVFGTEPLKALLREYGLGNHPEVVRVFARIGSAIASEDKSPPGKQQSTEQVNTLDLFYGPKK